MREVFVAVTPPHHDAEHDCEHQTRQQAAVEERGDRYAGDRSDRDEDEARRDGFGLRACCRQERDQIAGLGAALDHLGEQHRSDGGHIGGLRAGNARHQVHRRNQHVLQATAHVAEQAGEEADHGARHAGHLDQQAEEDEQRHRQQDEMAHAFIHAPNHDRRWCAGGQGDVGKGRKTEGECDRHGGKNHDRNQSDEEDQEIDIAERDQDRAQRIEHRADPNDERDALPESRQSPNDDRRRQRNQSIRPRPIGSAGPARGLKYRAPGSRPRPRRPRIRRPDAAPATRKASGAAIASTSKNARTCGRTIPTKAVMRMCSPRWKAVTAPSIASHRKRIPASSSVQMIGFWNT